jgi:hypothetical protein
MQVEIFTLCDAATIDHGKMNLLGTFDTLNFLDFPDESPNFAVAARVRFRPDQAGEHELHVGWFDSDGEEIERSESEFFIVDLVDGFEVANMIWPVYGKTFHEPDELMLRLFVDGRPVADVPLHVRHYDEGE